MYVSSRTMDVVLNARCRCPGLCGQDATRHLSKGSAQPPYLGYDLEPDDDAIRVGVAPVECADGRKRAKSIGARGSIDFCLVSIVVMGTDDRCCRWLDAGYGSGWLQMQ